MFDFDRTILPVLLDIYTHHIISLEHHYCCLVVTLSEQYFVLIGEMNATAVSRNGRTINNRKTNQIPYLELALSAHA